MGQKIEYDADVIIITHNAKGPVVDNNFGAEKMPMKEYLNTRFGLAGYTVVQMVPTGRIDQFTVYAQRQAR